MNTLTYKGYTARVEFDDRDNTFWGKVLGVDDGITWQTALPPGGRHRSRRAAS